MKAHVKLVEKTEAIRSAVLMLAVSFVTAIPAQAATLHGYVSDTADSASSKIYSAAVQEAVAPARTDSFPAELQGTWECVSTVIDSLVDTVVPGQQVVSRLNFVKVDDGRIMARFQQPGWTETQASVTAFSTASYVMDKTNFYYGDQTNGGWAARSRDHYQVVDPNKMVSESEVDQYVGGQYVGRYRTRSLLVRIGGFENVAMERGSK